MMRRLFGSPSGSVLGALADFWRRGFLLAGPPPSKTVPDALEEVPSLSIIYCLRSCSIVVAVVRVLGLATAVSDKMCSPHDLALLCFCKTKGVAGESNEFLGTWIKKGDMRTCSRQEAVPRRCDAIIETDTD